MKKIFLILFAVICVMILGCRNEAKCYRYQHSIEAIEAIEIVDAKHSLDFYVLKSFSQEEQTEFLKDFQQLKFYKLYGDPMPVCEEIAIRIVYDNGNYDMISWRTVEWVNKENFVMAKQYCKPKEDFYSLIDKYFKEK